MTNVKEIVNFLNRIFPFDYQESYDNSGLLVGEPDTRVKGLLITLDVTESVVDESIANNCNVILAHHPIIFHGLKQLTGATFETRTIMKAIRNNIAIIASHTNTDNTINGGTNHYLAKFFDLQELQSLLPVQGALRKLVTFVPIAFATKVREALFAAGAGIIGNYDKTSFVTYGLGSFRGNIHTQAYSGMPDKFHLEKEIRIETIFPKHLEHKIIESLISVHPYEEVAYDIFTLNNKYPIFGSGIIGYLPKKVKAFDFLQKIKTVFGGIVRYTTPATSTINKVAICGGSGSFLLQEAIRQQADIFITSDTKYHQFFDADKKIIIADVGHYESEQFTKEIFFSLIQNNFSTFALHLSKINTNPINYL